MRILFVSYCFGTGRIHRQIGVYKRCLRLGLALRGRGHEVFIHCTGFHTYEDSLTREAFGQLQFLDPGPPDSGQDPAFARRFRRHCKATLSAVKPDQVLIGELPLAGSLLEMSLCAIEAEIPVTIVDNLYSPELGVLAWDQQQGFADRFLCAGPSSFHAPVDSPRWGQVAPFVTPDNRIPQPGAPQKTVTVLGYDPGVEDIGVALYESFRDRAIRFVFLTPREEELKRRLAGMTGGGAATVEILAPPDDSTYFTIVGLADLVIAKQGYMQLTECLALRTPVFMIHRGNRVWAHELPEAVRPFIYTLQGDSLTPEARAEADRLLGLEPEMLEIMHQGNPSGIEDAVQFVEQLPADPVTLLGDELAQFGISRDHLAQALEAKLGEAGAEIRGARGLRVRMNENEETYVVAIRCALHGRERCCRFWAHSCRSTEAFGNHVERGRRAFNQRLLLADEANRIAIEENHGEARLKVAKEWVDVA